MLLSTKKDRVVGIFTTPFISGLLTRAEFTIGMWDLNLLSKIYISNFYLLEFFALLVALTAKPFYDKDIP
jgi:hypothetical protein